VAEGGYLSWFVPATGQWWQRTWFGGSAPADRQLASLQIRNGNLRNAIDRITARDRSEKMSGARSLMAAAKAGAAGGKSTAFKNRASALRAAMRKAMG
jgi:hypothetical protein